MARKAKQPSTAEGQPQPQASATPTSGDSLDIGGERVRTFDEELDSVLNDPANSEQPPASTEPPAEEEGTSASEEGAPASEEGATPTGEEGQPPSTGEAEEGEPGEGEGAPTGEESEKPKPLTEEGLVRALQQLNRSDGQPGSTSEQEGAQQTQEPLPEVTPEDFITEEERGILREYDKNWDDVSQAEAIRTRAAVDHAKYDVLSQVANYLAPLVDRLNAVQVEQQRGTIRSAHSDYEQVMEQLPGWIESQHPLYRKAMQQVLETGSAEEVKSLLDLYKESTGETESAPGTIPDSSTTGTKTTAKPTGSGAPAKPTVRRKTEDSKLQEAAAATAGVRSGRPEPVQRDAEDFDGALQEVLAKRG